MKKLHFKIALNSIKNNLKIFMPNLIVCSLMVCISYILFSLADSPFLLIDGSKGILRIGGMLIWLFSWLFLSYTNSIVIKSRLSEYGLYNLLGFDKKNLCRINFIETCTIGIPSILIGCIGGMLLSKIPEISFLNTTQQDINFSFGFDPLAFNITFIVFSVIFLMTYSKNKKRIKRGNPIDLARNSEMGDKPPKSNVTAGIFGLIILLICYIFALIPVEEFHTKTLLFFVSACGVIIGTYIVFKSLSVSICTMLQKNKKFYYVKEHFVSVSMLKFRMKKNGSGLASISIFLTIIFIVSIMTTCILSGVNKLVYTNCPQDVCVSNTYSSKSNPKIISEIDNTVQDIAMKNKIDVRNISEIHLSKFFWNINGNSVIVTKTVGQGYANFISIDDLNIIIGQNLQVNPNEMIVFSNTTSNNIDTINIGGKTYTASKQKVELPEYLSIDKACSFIAYDSKDINTCQNIFDNVYEKETRIMFDADTRSEGFTNFSNDIDNAFLQYRKNPNYSSCLTSITTTTKQETYQRLQSLYGMLSFIGISLSFIFAISTIIIIYYKQISEGFQDADRYKIMKKIGMSKEDIKKSTNSQTVIVFMLPIIIAVINTVFALPTIGFYGKLFLPSGSLLWLSELCIISIGIVLYLFAYKITSKAYLSIVSKA